MGTDFDEDHRGDPPLSRVQSRSVKLSACEAVPIRC
jgi:hypothetical protein